MRRSKTAPSLRGSSRTLFAVVAVLTASLISTSLLIPHAARADRDPETGRWVGDTSPRNFEEFCNVDRPGERRAEFFAALDKADRALSSHDLKSARKAFDQARDAGFRGGADSDLWVKCLGRSAAERWFEGQLELTRQRSRADSRGRVDESAGLYVSAVDLGAQATISLVEGMAARSAVASIRRLERILDQLDHERDFGAFMLKKEDALARTCREALRSLRDHAAQEHRSALQAELKSFSRPLTDNERAAMNAAGGVQDFAEALSGASVAAKSNPERIELDRRVGESRDLLRTARTWNLETYPDRQASPSAKRARQRGDELMASAGDPASNLWLRDDLYKAAQRYYEFGGFAEESAHAATARATLQPALAAERDRQDALFEKAAASLEDQAESARQAAEEMKKSASEQQQFKDEADALEAELGF